MTSKGMRLALLMVGILAASTVGFTQAAPDRGSLAAIPMIPTAQKSCTQVEFTVPVGSWLADPGLKATVNNGTATKNVVLQYSSETKVDSSGGLLSLGYSIDGGSVTLVGPEFFSSDFTQWGARTAIGVVTLGPGVHSIQPMLFYSGASNGFVFFRCFTAEKNSN
jgi:hypothetical protein